MINVELPLTKLRLQKEKGAKFAEKSDKEPKNAGILLLVTLTMAQCNRLSHHHGCQS